MADLRRREDCFLAPMIRLPRLARHSALYIAIPVAQRLVYFLLVPLFTRYLTPSEYGAWGYVTVAATLLGTLAPLGLIAAYNFALKRPETFTSGGGPVRRASLRMACAVVVLSSVAAFPILRLVPLETPRTDLLWAVVLAATAAGFLVQVAKRRYQMLEAPGPYAGIELSYGLAVAAGSFLGVVVFGWSVLGMAFGLALGAGLGLVWAVPPLVDDLRTPGGREARREALAFGLPLFIHTGAAVLLQFADRFMLERMSTLSELGLYSLAGQIGTAMLIISTSTNLAYLPFLYRQHEADPSLVARAQRYIALFFALIGVVGFLITPPVIKAFIDPRYAGAALPAQILLVAGIFHGWYFLALGSLLVRKETKLIAWVTVVAATLNIGANFYVIPRYHSLGAAWTTLFAEVVLCAGMWWAARRVRQKTPLQHAADVLAAES